MQTSPSGPSLGALTLDSAQKSGPERTSAGNDEFSQEYDKQVKNMESSGQPESSSEPRATKSEGQTESTEKPETEAATEQVLEAEEQVATSEEQGGKSLPLEAMRKMAAEVGLQADGEEHDTDDIALEPQLSSADEEGIESTEPSIVPLVAQPQQEAAKSQATPIAAAVKEALAPKSQTGQTAVTNSDEITTEDEVALDSELPDLQTKTRVKGDELAAMTTRQTRQATEGMPRGDRAFEAMLAAQGRAQPTAASIDTLTPGITPLAGQGASNALATPAPVAMTLATPMAQANWGQAMAERVVWMTNANIQEAEIQLNPRELGPIGIKVTVQNEQTNVSFVAQHASTREALEQAIPRLREMLNENGLQLGQSDVSQQGFKGRDGEAEDGARGHPLAGDEVLEGDESMLGAGALYGVSQVGPAGVDAFA